MIGAIIGDIIGSAYEFQTTKEYDFDLFTHSSGFTDDSIMTYAVAQWLMFDPSRSAKELEKWMVKMGREYPNPKGGYGGSFAVWLTNENRQPYNSWGNGSAMRVSPVGWAFNTIEETERVAKITAEVTHNHPEGIKGAQATAASIWMARAGKTKNEIRDYLSQRFGYDLSDNWDSIHYSYSWDDSCQGTVPAAIICFLDSEDYEDAVRKAVSLGGDADTLACITGGIAEAFYHGVPEEILFKARPYFGSLCEDFYPHFMCWAHGNSMGIGRITPDRISELEDRNIFVFGSNISGFHGGGAARLAYERFGAKWGVGVGPTGQCYAIPTMQGGVETIKPYVDDFIAYAGSHPEQIFLVTRIGCGIAGFSVAEIAPLFREAIKLENVKLPEDFWKNLR